MIKNEESEICDSFFNDMRANEHTNRLCTLLFFEIKRTNYDLFNSFCRNEIHPIKASCDSFSSSKISSASRSWRSDTFSLLLPNRLCLNKSGSWRVYLKSIRVFYNSDFVSFSFVWFSSSGLRRRVFSFLNYSNKPNNVMPVCKADKVSFYYFCSLFLTFFLLEFYPILLRWFRWSQSDFQATESYQNAIS